MNCERNEKTNEIERRRESLSLVQIQFLPTKETSLPVSLFFYYRLLQNWIEAIERMSFQDLESGTLPQQQQRQSLYSNKNSNSSRNPYDHHRGRGGDGGGEYEVEASQAVAAGIFQLNTAVNNFYRLVNSLGTPKDTLQLRDKLSVFSLSTSYTCIHIYIHCATLIWLSEE